MITRNEALEAKFQGPLKCIIDFLSGRFAYIRVYNNKDDFETFMNANKGNIGLIITPELLISSNIKSVDEFFMVGILEDKLETHL